MTTICNINRYIYQRASLPYPVDISIYIIKTSLYNRDTRFNNLNKV